VPALLCSAKRLLLVFFSSALFFFSHVGGTHRAVGRMQGRIVSVRDDKFKAVVSYGSDQEELFLDQLQKILLPVGHNRTPPQDRIASASAAGAAPGKTSVQK
jgi:hypothetical protein